MKYYAGIGSRETPKEILDLMTKTAFWLWQQGWTLQTGACKGADQAFAKGALNSTMFKSVLLCLPWDGYENDFVRNAIYHGAVTYTLQPTDPMDMATFDSVKKYHPAAEKLGRGARALHARNWLIIKGVKFMICWTPGGRVTGGTGQALRIAADLGITIFNLAKEEDRRRIEEKIQ